MIQRTQRKMHARAIRNNNFKRAEQNNAPAIVLYAHFNYARRRRDVFRRCAMSRRKLYASRIHPQQKARQLVASRCGETAGTVKSTFPRSPLRDRTRDLDRLSE